MSRFRKKPVEIDAMRWVTGMPDGYVQRVFDWLDAGGCNWEPAGDGGLDIITLEGTMRAADGDWIIRGVAGEFYPCKPDIFDATSEQIGEDV